MGEAVRIGKCQACGQDIYRGARSGVYIGHKSRCKNARTKRLEG